MVEYKLTYPNVVRLCNVTVPTVDQWFQLDTAAEYQNMPVKSLDIFVKSCPEIGFSKTMKLQIHGIVG